MKIKIGSRGSNLAMTQTNYIKDMILEKFPDLEIEIVKITTTGDRVWNKTIQEIGGKEIFVKEIEKALLNGEIDMAVHSMKDMPGELPRGLCLGFVPKREDPRDVLVMDEKSLEEIRNIGTGSLRRKLQVKEIFKKSRVLGVRGNVETRMKLVDNEKIDGVVLAKAGLNRLGLEPKNTYTFSVEEMLPSPTQGILAIEFNESNRELIEMLEVLTDRETKIQAHYEREFLKAVGGSCSVPVGAYCEVDGNNIKLTGMLGDKKGTYYVKDSILGKVGDDLSYTLAENLKEKLKITKPKGRVYLVGAGPGDEGLITVKGLECIKKADVVVYDRLSSPNLLSEAKNNAKFIFVGKEPNNHAKTQDEINEILYQEALSGNIVTRLKGGDPYVFGRGGEEGEYLYDRGIEFEVVPGISSSIGGLAYGGIPITQRNVATSFHVITGHTRDDEELDYDTFAKLEGTLVFLMGVKNLEKIASGLVNSGKSKDTPVALVHWATTSKQRVVTGTLENIVKVVKREKITNPSLIVIGEVVNMRESLDFTKNMPLFGKNIVITREAKRAKETISKFRDLGANVISLPMIKTEFIDSEELDDAINNIKDFKYIFFTSVNGVNFFFDKFLEKSDIRNLNNIKFIAIGSKTYNALKKYGIKSDLMPENFEGMEAVKVIEENIKRGTKILVPRAKLGRNEIVDSLKENYDIKEVKIYDTISAIDDSKVIYETLSDLEEYYLVFTSSSTFTNFKNIAGDEFFKDNDSAKIISIGPITTKTINDEGLSVYKEAREYTIDGIIEILKEENIGF